MTELELLRQLRDAVRFFKENEHTEKRGQALRALWDALDKAGK